MQRTVYSTKFTYAKTTIHEDGTVTATLDTITIHEADPTKALKKAFKENGYFNPIKTEKVSKLWVLDDEIFFKYAAPVDTPTDTPTEDTETE